MTGSKALQTRHLATGVGVITASRPGGTPVGLTIRSRHRVSRHAAQRPMAASG